MAFESIINRINEERIKKGGVYVTPIKEVGKEYIRQMLYCSEYTHPNRGEVVEKTIESIERNYGLKVRCGVEIEKMLDVLRILGGSTERYPTGWEDVIERYSDDEECLSLGKIIVYLERKIKPKDDDYEDIIIA